MVAARELIERLLYEYSASVDGGDFATTADLFGETGLYGMVGAGAACGSQQVLQVLAGNVRLYDGRPRTRHIVTNIVVDLAPDELSATVRSYIHMIHQPPDGLLAPLVAGTYHDRVHYVNGRWLFAERRMHIELAGDLSTHLFRPLTR